MPSLFISWGQVWTQTKKCCKFKEGDLLSRFGRHEFRYGSCSTREQTRTNNPNEVGNKFAPTVIVALITASQRKSTQCTSMLR